VCSALTHSQHWSQRVNDVILVHPAPNLQEARPKVLLVAQAAPQPFYAHGTTTRTARLARTCAMDVSLPAAAGFGDRDIVCVAQRR